MKKIVLFVLLAFGLMHQANAQEVKTEIEIVDRVKTVFMTVNADRFQDLRGFDWRTHLTEVFKDVPDDAIIGIKVNIGAKQLTDDIATLNNKMSLLEVGTANNKEKLLRSMVRNVQLFIEDEQQGNNVD